jgi:hypothetical protein
MKQVKKWVSVNAVNDAATFLYENGITVIIAYHEEGNLFGDDKVNLIMAVPEAVLPLLDTQRMFKN